MQASAAGIGNEAGNVVSFSVVSGSRVGALYHRRSQVVQTDCRYMKLNLHSLGHYDLD